MNYLNTAIVVCENLTEWDLSNNNIDEEGMIALTENMPELFPNLKFCDGTNVVSLVGNPVSMEFLLMCDQQLKVNSC